MSGKLISCDPPITSFDSGLHFTSISWRARSVGDAVIRAGNVTRRARRAQCRARGWRMRWPLVIASLDAALTRRTKETGSRKRATSRLRPRKRSGRP